MGLVVAVLVVLGVVAAVVALTVQGKTPLSSDEQQIEAALRDFYGTMTDDGFAAATQQACRADRDAYEAMPEAQRTQTEKLGFGVDIESVDGVVVTGDRATAQISGTFTIPGGTSDDSSDETLAKEDGEWRVCSSLVATGG